MAGLAITKGCLSNVRWQAWQSPKAAIAVLDGRPGNHYNQVILREVRASSMDESQQQESCRPFVSNLFCSLTARDENTSS
ncbi:hypothetical protein RRG08_033056 [Elysia crispata]|uniref:Uncharacterized protein n=1 Tax=Elysia crispata TaxID=231223 RepID=A0AAE1DU45_9GAST|nr:hypothetical protein RRG08_033056 [Elysia crispata]